MTEPDHIIITKLERHGDGWTANVNGQPFRTTGLSGTMSAWVSGDREALPVVRRALLKKVRQAERREQETNEQEVEA
jgi:hypothetical protein